MKNINHWIAELRRIALAADLRTEVAKGEFKKMPKSERIKLFNKANFKDQFDSGYTPQEAFENEMEAWQDSL